MCTNKLTRVFVAPSGLALFGRRGTRLLALSQVQSPPRSRERTTTMVVMIMHLAVQVCLEKDRIESLMPETMSSRLRLACMCVCLYTCAYGGCLCACVRTSMHTCIELRAGHQAWTSDIYSTWKHLC